MSLLSFMKDAGEKLFASPKAQAAPAQAQPAAPAAPAAGAQQAQDVKNGEIIRDYITTLGLKADGFNVKYDSATYTATVSGTAPDKETKEKIVVAAGNVMNVAKVDDNLSIASGHDGDAGATFHTVEKGDTLSKIAKKEYGDANKYQRIFEANQPMLKSPDLIYPGQVLRIPKEDRASA